MNAPATFPNPRADELRRRAIYAERVAKAAQAFADDYQREPELAQIKLLDAVRFAMPDFADGLTEMMAELLDWRGLDEDGYMRGHDRYGEPVRGEQLWQTLGPVA